MKLLAISDTYIPRDVMRRGLAALEPLGGEIEVRSWEHPTLVALQEANLLIEKEGPEAVPLGDEVVRGLDEFDIVVVQFAPLSCSFLAAARRLKIVAVLRGGTEHRPQPRLPQEWPVAAVVSQ